MKFNWVTFPPTFSNPPWGWYFLQRKHIFLGAFPAHGSLFRFLNFPDIIRYHDILQVRDAFYWCAMNIRANQQLQFCCFFFIYWSKFDSQVNNIEKILRNLFSIWLIPACLFCSRLSTFYSISRTWTNFLAINKDERWILMNFPGNSEENFSFHEWMNE